MSGRGSRDFSFRLTRPLTHVQPTLILFWRRPPTALAAAAFSLSALRDKLRCRDAYLILVSINWHVLFGMPCANGITSLPVSGTRQPAYNVHGCVSQKMTRLCTQHLDSPIS